MRVEHALHVVGELHGAAGEDLEVRGPLAALRREALLERVAVDVHAVGPKPIGSQPSAQLGGQRGVRGAARRHPDRDAAGWVQDRLQRLALPERARARVRQRDLGAVVGDRLLAVEHLADDRDVVAQPRRSGLPHGWPYQPSTICGPDTPMPDDHPAAAGERVDRHGVHGERSPAGGPRAARRAVPSLIRVGERGEVGERRQRVGSRRPRRSTPSGSRATRPGAPGRPAPRWPRPGRGRGRVRAAPVLLRSERPPERDGQSMGRPAVTPPST